MFNNQHDVCVKLKMCR